ncbi:MAG: Mrp/NBP35 family ATP-binding protein [candidate division WOR-3 bacterium]
MKITDVYAVLRRVKHGDGDVVSAGFVKGVSITGERVSVVFLFPDEMRGKEKPLLEEARKLLEAEGAEKIDFEVNFAILTGKKSTADLKKRPIPGVKNVILVTSGKGGVGKSTVAANLAAELALRGLRVGLFDADVYGPSVPTLMGIQGAEIRAENDKIIPVEAYRVKVMSLGLMLEDDSPVIWRGPLVHKAYEQLLFETNWGELDFLVLDLPPGTGDAQLSMAQLVEIAGGLVVTTPQVLAINDVRRALSMLRKVDVPAIGIVETMSYYKCPGCGREENIFGEGGGERLSAETGVPLLAKIPMEIDLVAASDAGIPIVVAKPNSEATKAFVRLAEEVVSYVTKGRVKSVED